MDSHVFLTPLYKHERILTFSIAESRKVYFYWASMERSIHLDWYGTGVISYVLLIWVADTGELADVEIAGVEVTTVRLFIFACS